MFSDPIKNLKQLGLREDMIVADLGAGTGFYTIATAKLVPMGKVYAVEVIKEYVATIKNKARESNLNNVECFWGNIENIGGTKLKDGIIDVVIASNVFFQVENKDGFISEIKRILKPNGKILFVDWTDDSSFLGPKKDEIISKDKVLEIFGRKNISFEKDIDAGAHHYGMILINKKL